MVRRVQRGSRVQNWEVVMTARSFKWGRSCVGEGGERGAFWHGGGVIVKTPGLECYSVQGQ